MLLSVERAFLQLTLPNLYAEQFKAFWED